MQFCPASFSQVMPTSNSHRSGYFGSRKVLRSTTGHLTLTKRSQIPKVWRRFNLNETGIMIPYAKHYKWATLWMPRGTSGVRKNMRKVRENCWAWRKHGILHLINKACQLNSFRVAKRPNIISHRRLYSNVRRIVTLGIASPCLQCCSRNQNAIKNDVL